MEPEITDIFDRIMNWKLLRFMWPFYKKNKDKLLYLFFGGCTTLVNLVITYGLWYGLKWEQWYALWQSPAGASGDRRLFLS